VAKITQNAVTIHTEYKFYTYYTPTKFVPPIYCLKEVETATSVKGRNILIHHCLCNFQTAFHALWYATKPRDTFAKIEFYEASFPSNTMNIARFTLAALKSTVLYFFLAVKLSAKPIWYKTRGYKKDLFKIAIYKNFNWLKQWDL